MKPERIGYFFIILLFVIGIIGTIARYSGEGDGGAARLGVLGGGVERTCTGTLTMSAESTGGKCRQTANVVMENCQGKRWYVFEGSECEGTLVCDGDIDEAVSRWSCNWEVTSGNRGYTLCEGINAKDFKSVTCST